MEADVDRLDAARTRVHPTAFVAPGAVVVGDVEVGEDASIWFGVVARGDRASLRVGSRSNVQDLTVLHADPGFPCTLEEGVTVGHRCIVHGATVGRGSLVGMGAILMNGAVIGPGSLVAAGSLVTEGKVFPEGVLIMGSPAKVVRPLTAAERESLVRSADGYVENGRRYRAADLDRLLAAGRGRIRVDGERD